ncbi:MAG: GTP 3',8-cyclase MoaA [bacterium]
MELKDKPGSVIKYLRLSVTDRCNQRCIYCMPKDGINFLPYENILRLEDLAALASRFVEIFEIDKIRLTGGEPLGRKNIEYLIETLSHMPGIREITLTTNGTMLKQKARSLRMAGLNRINVSLDSLDPEKYAYITGGSKLEDVLTGLKIAREVGLDPIKINTVLLPGFNESRQFVEWADKEGYMVRFIEFMPPLADTRIEINGTGPAQADIIHELEGSFGEIMEINKSGDSQGKVARQCGFKGNGMVFGIIPATTDPFCGTCNRIRIDCKGDLRSCLYSDDSLNLINLIDAPDVEFIAAIADFIGRKSGRKLTYIGSNMSSIGG